MDFYIIYRFVAIAAVLATPLLFERRHFAQLRPFRTLLLLSLLATYGYGMSRYWGVDFGNYTRAFLGEPYIIPEIGFQCLTSIFLFFSLSLTNMIQLIGVVSVYSLYRVSKKFEISFLFLFLIYFLHLAVVRDFAQLRIGFALSICLLAFCSESSMKKIFLYILALAFHKVSFAFILPLLLSHKISTYRDPALRNTLILLLIVAAIIPAIFLEYLVFLDERIYLYMVWDKPGYGQPVDSWSGLYFQVLLLIICLWGYYKFKQASIHVGVQYMRLFTYLQLIGVVVFIFFSEYAAFSARLSNVLCSLYPIAIAFIMKLEYMKGHSIIDRFSKVAVAQSLQLTLLLRPGSDFILKYAKVWPM